MIYENTKRAVFLNRPNRFVASILLDGRPTVCHVKNTGRCRELLTPNADIIVQMAAPGGRETCCDLIAVYKGGRLINMDAAAPNRVFGEYLAAGGLGFVPDAIRPEFTHGDSRFDFRFSKNGRQALAEVKGVTLEDGGIVRFPDAPTVRGVKHLRGLAQAAAEGFDCWAVFIVQMCGVKYMEPNWSTHPEFGEALIHARDAGVRILALDCSVTENSITARAPVEVKLNHGKHI